MKARTKILHFLFLLVLQIWRLVSAVNMEQVGALSKHREISDTCQQKLSVETQSVSKRPQDLFYALQICVSLHGYGRSPPTSCSSTNNLNPPGTIELALRINNPETGESKSFPSQKIKYNGNPQYCIVYHPCVVQQLLREFSPIKDKVKIIGETSIYGFQSSGEDTFFYNEIWGSGAIITEPKPVIMWNSAAYAVIDSNKSTWLPFTGVCKSDSTKRCGELITEQLEFLDKTNLSHIEGSASCLLGDEFSNDTFVTYYNPSDIVISDMAEAATMETTEELPTMDNTERTTMPKEKMASSGSLKLKLINQKIPEAGFKQTLKMSNGIGRNAKLNQQHNIIVFGLASIIKATMYS